MDSFEADVARGKMFTSGVIKAPNVHAEQPLPRLDLILKRNKTIYMDRKCYQTFLAQLVCLQLPHSVIVGFSI